MSTKNELAFGTWYPIETAPKGFYERFLVARSGDKKNPLVCEAIRLSNGNFYTRCAQLQIFDLDKWMPLPKPPLAKTEGEE